MVSSISPLKVPVQALAQNGHNGVKKKRRGSSAVLFAFGPSSSFYESPGLREAQYSFIVVSSHFPGGSENLLPLAGACDFQLILISLGSKVCFIIAKIAIFLALLSDFDYHQVQSERQVVKVHAAYIRISYCKLIESIENLVHNIFLMVRGLFSYFLFPNRRGAILRESCRLSQSSLKGGLLCSFPNSTST